MLAAAGIGIAAWQGKLTPAAEVTLTSIQLVYPSQTVTLLNASGYLVAQRKAAVASKITGRLVHLAVEEGSRVKSGEVIARLENGDLLAARDRARAHLSAARADLQQALAEKADAELAFQRSRSLVESQFIARAEFDQANARFLAASALVEAKRSLIESSRAALEEAEVMLDYALLRAPFDSVVLTKNADVGDIVTPLGAAANAKAAVVDVADMSSLLVEVDVSESNIGLVHIGQPCEVQLDALPDERFPGRVHMIVPTADRTKASVMVKVALDTLDARMLPEMSAKTAFLSRPLNPEERRPVKAVVSEAVVERNGRKMVFGVENGQAVEIPVQTGENLDQMIRLMDGPEIGRRVVVNPGKRIRDGVRVKTAS
jgi:RND family efflux transporter MFP subunit